MTKKQKTWLLVFLGLFIVPEVLFSFIISSILFLFNIKGPYLIAKIISNQLVVDNPNIVLLMISTEAAGLLGLTVFNLRLNKKKYSGILSFIMSLIFCFLCLILYSIFVMRNGIGF